MIFSPYSPIRSLVPGYYKQINFTEILGEVHYFYGLLDIRQLKLVINYNFNTHLNSKLQKILRAL